MLPRESYAKAVRPALVWRLPSAALRRVLAAYPSIGVAITQQIGSRFKRVESRVEHLVFRSVPSRVAGMLLELGDDFGHRTSSGLAINLALSQEELATLVGASRQRVNASLRTFEREGTIRRNGRQLVLIRPDALLRTRDGRSP
jgi:CRP-like cAMP-binding protein